MKISILTKLLQVAALLKKIKTPELAVLHLNLTDEINLLKRITKQISNYVQCFNLVCINIYLLIELADEQRKLTQC